MPRSILGRYEQTECPVALAREAQRDARLEEIRREVTLRTPTMRAARRLARVFVVRRGFNALRKVA